MPGYARQGPHCKACPANTFSGELVALLTPLRACHTGLVCAAAAATCTAVPVIVTCQHAIKLL